MIIDIIEELNIDKLREVFSKYIKRASELLPHLNFSRILDVGCGSGTVSIELAKLMNGEIASIDIDEAALDKFRSKLTRLELSNRITISNRSIYNTEFQPGIFEIVWEEGVIHLLNIKNALKEIQRILRINGFFVSLETKEWFKSNLELFFNHGFVIIEKMELPEQYWLKEYYLPLESKIEELKLIYKNSEELNKLKPFEDEIKMVKKNPKKFDCVYYIFKKKDMRA